MDFWEASKANCRRLRRHLGNLSLTFGSRSWNPVAEPRSKPAPPAYLNYNETAACAQILWAKVGRTAASGAWQTTWPTCKLKFESRARPKSVGGIGAGWC